MSDDNELVFAPLGGLGEIGMNCALYGFGPPRSRKWLMVDLGLAFAGDDLPGVDLIMPDLAFIEKVKKDLVGLIITHAHEDHIGALADLWPRLGVPVYMTRFAAGLAEARRLGEPGAPKIPIKVVAQGGRLDIGPFNVEFIAVAHSIPESCALAIRTPAGLVVHTGDWKIDPTPMIGSADRRARACRELGEEGVLALICNSTNVLREGESPSEADVAENLAAIVGKAKGRVVVTTFASNVARLRAAAEAGFANGRQVCVMGRAMERVVAVARECGYLDGVPPLARPGPVRAPAARQGARARHRQPGRAARGAGAHRRGRTSQRLLWRAATSSSSPRAPFPATRRRSARSSTALVTQGVEVVTDRTQLVHVSGHPRRAEVAQMYAWLKPKIAVPAHGEPLHLSEHVAFAKAQGVVRSCALSTATWCASSTATRGWSAASITAGCYKDGEILLHGGRRLRRPAPQAFLRRRGVDRARPDRQGRNGGRPGRPDRRTAEEYAAGRRPRRDRSTPRSSKRSRACRAASGATPTSSAARSSAPCATPSTPPGARSRRCTC